MKNNKGITLIALVITIVVLIILAVVAVNLSLGNNGLFNKAKTAKEQYQNAQDYEKTEIAKTANEIDSYVGGNRDYTPISYSTEEQDTRLKWVNGKKIYQKTLSGTTTSSAFSTIQIDISSLNIDTLVDYKLMFYTGTYAFKDQMHDTSYFLWAQKNGNYFEIKSGNKGFSNLNYYLTLQYTKTTD